MAKRRTKEEQEKEREEVKRLLDSPHLKRAHAQHEKRKIIENLFCLWVEHPHQRLGQLIGNVLGSEEPLFYVEDFDLDRLLNEFRDEHSG